MRKVYKQIGHIYQKRFVILRFDEVEIQQAIYI